MELIDYIDDSIDHSDSGRDFGLDLPRKVLVVDDSPTIRANLQLALEGNYPLIEAADGEAAWQHLLADRGIEVVITDLVMPRLDGYALIQRMRNSKNSRISGTPVIVIAGGENVSLKEKAFAAGANDFIGKTVDWVELRARVGAALKLANTIRELQESRQILRRRAYTDHLTGLMNRRSFFENAGRSLALMRRHEEDLTIIMIDIDHFKMINDRFGHQAGDHVLKKIGKVLSSVIRDEDVLARIGGEEFAVALPYTSKLGAVVLAERWRQQIKEADFGVDGNTISITMSQGLSSLRPHGEDTLDLMMARADQRLYIAKRRGRDQVCSNDESDQNVELSRSNRKCPRMSEALEMLRHGHSAELDAHLHKLFLEVLPLFERANQIPGIDFDLDRIRMGIASLNRKS